MDIVKNIILIACVMGIITTIFEISSPEGKLKNQLQVIIGIITVLSIIAPFTDNGFKINFDNMDFEDNSLIFTDEIQLDIDENVIKAAKQKTEEYFTDKLNKNNIDILSFNSEIITNNNDEIEIKSITITSDESIEIIKNLISENLPDTEIIVIEESKIESQN